MVMGSLLALVGLCPPQSNERAPASGVAPHSATTPKQWKKIRLRARPEVQLALDARLAEIMLLERIVEALAKDQFRWQPGAARQPAVANVFRAIDGHVVITDDTVRRLLRDIAQGGAQQARAARGKPLGPAASSKVVGSLRKLALGIAMAKFGWQSGANNQVSEAKIVKAIERQGVPIAREELRLCLHTADRELRT